VSCLSPGAENFLLHDSRAAGTDTSSFTATTSLLLLVNNPDKLERLVEELDTAFPSIDDPITFVKTQDLPYLNAVINEASRVFPVIVAGLYHRYEVIKKN